jgi:ElaB/YqjD/DUF883 family membrane-anchored ribosome-binding protein
MKKITRVFAAVLLLSMLGVLALPFVFKDEINQRIKVEINNYLLADVDYASYDLSVIKSFPDLYFSLKDLNVVGRGVFAGDTLATLDEFGISIDLMQYIRNDQLFIRELYVEHPSILAYQLVTEEGDTLRNYDILPSTEEQETQSDVIDIEAEEITFVDANIYYKDFISGMEFISTNMDMQLAVDYQGNMADMQLKSSMEGLSFSDGSTSYLNDVAFDAEIDVFADLAKDSFYLRDNQLSLNALKLQADGFLSLPAEDLIRMDLSFSAAQSSFKELLSLVPPSYLKDYEQIEANGFLSLEGSVQGELSAYTSPFFDMHLKVEDADIKYPDFPTGVSQIQLDARVYNESTDYRTMSLDLPLLSFTIDEQPISLSLYARELLLDPWLDVKLKGDLDLNKVPNYYPLDGVSDIGGQLHADLRFEGLLSHVENEQYEQVDFEGDIQLNQLKLDAEDLTMPVEVEQMDILFSPAYGELNVKNLKLGESDFQINGQVENVINYVFAEAVLKGSLDIQSEYINLDELLGEDESEDESTSTATKIPANILFVSSLRAQEIFYDGLVMEKLNGVINAEDEVLVLQNLSANMLGGKANISGSYATKNTDKPQIELQYAIDKFDIQQTFEHLNTVRAIAPMAKYLMGSFSSTMTLSSVLNNDLSLDLSALSGKGDVRVPYASFSDFPIWQKVSKTLQLPALEKPSLQDAWTVFQFENGRVDVEPFEVKMKDVDMQIAGSNGFDQSIDYQISLRVPSDKFGGAATLANNFLSKQSIPLLNLAVPQSITFYLDVSGMLSEPQVSIAKVSVDQSEKGVKEQLKENIQDQLDDVKEQAKEELDKVKEKVEEVKDKAKDEVQQEVEKMKEDIKENIKDKLKGKGFGW